MGYLPRGRNQQRNGYRSQPFQDRDARERLQPWQPWKPLRRPGIWTEGWTRRSRSIPSQTAHCFPAWLLGDVCHGIELREGDSSWQWWTLPKEDVCRWLLPEVNVCTHPHHSHSTSGLDISIRTVGEGSPGWGVDLYGWCWGIRGREAGGCWEGKVVGGGLIAFAPKQTEEHFRARWKPPP